jgi:hypothetical protein
MQIKPMTTAFAADIATWRYPPPSDCYDMAGIDPAALADPDSGFFALTDASGLLGSGPSAATARCQEARMTTRPWTQAAACAPS